MSNMVEKILEQIRNGEITIEDGDGRFPAHPLDLFLQYDFAIERIYGFNQ